MESPAHLKGKQIIAELCKRFGFEAKIEAQGSDWRADVLAQKEHRKIAFEIQLNPQNLRDSKIREKRYTRDGIEVIWLSPVSNALNSKIPPFELSSDSSNELFIKFRGQDYLLADFIPFLLNEKIKLLPRIEVLTKRYFKIIFFPENCWKCHKDYHLFYVSEAYSKSQCNLKVNVDNFMDLQETNYRGGKIEFEEEIVQAVLEIATQDKQVHVGKIKSRYSKMMGYSSISMGCPWCDALYGNHYLHTNVLQWRFDESNPTLIKHVYEKTIPVDTYQNMHWCFPNNQNFCK